MTTSPTSTAPLATPADTLDDDPPVTSVMSHEVVVIDAEARLPTALRVMATTGVRHLPVVERGRCLGVLVETDLIRSLAQDTRPSGSMALDRAVAAPLRQLHRPAPQLPPTARVSDAARHMATDVSDAVLVVDGGLILGIVTATDLVRLLACRDARPAPSAT
jgi:CBS domain-containing protein